MPSLLERVTNAVALAACDVSRAVGGLRALVAAAPCALPVVVQWLCENVATRGRRLAVIAARLSDYSATLTSVCVALRAPHMQLLINLLPSLLDDAGGSIGVAALTTTTTTIDAALCVALGLGSTASALRRLVAFAAASAAPTIHALVAPLRALLSRCDAAARKVRLGSALDDVDEPLAVLAEMTLATAGCEPAKLGIVVQSLAQACDDAGEWPRAELVTGVLCSSLRAVERGSSLALALTTLLDVAAAADALMQRASPLAAAFVGDAAAALLTLAAPTARRPRFAVRGALAMRRVQPRDATRMITAAAAAAALVDADRDVAVVDIDENDDIDDGAVAALVRMCAASEERVLVLALRVLLPSNGARDDESTTLLRACCGDRSRRLLLASATRSAPDADETRRLAMLCHAAAAARADNTRRATLDTVARAFALLDVA